jgi:predicted Zn-dependent peptidase
MLLRPTLPGLEIEKRIITEEALEDINEGGEEINTHNLASRLLWAGHPLGNPTIGYLETIEKFTRDDLLAHLARYYTPENAVAVIAGAISADVAIAACREHFGTWQAAAALPGISPAECQTSPQTLFVEDSDSQVHLQIAFRGFARPDRRIMATRLLRRMLCGSGSSRLNLNLRERLGIVYSVDASISAYEETGSFAIELSTAPENLSLAVAEILRETMRMAREAAAPEEILRVKGGYYYDLDYSRDSSYEMQVRYGWGELMGLVRSIEEDQAEAATLDGEAIRATAAALFAPRNFNLVAVGPWKPADRREVERIVADYEKGWHG